MWSILAVIHWLNLKVPTYVLDFVTIDFEKTDVKRN